METANFTVKGMHCKGCAQIIENALARMDGVQQSSASHEGEAVRVLYDPARIDSDRIASTIQKAGYHVEAKA